MIQHKPVVSAPRLARSPHPRSVPAIAIGRRLQCPLTLANAYWTMSHLERTWTMKENSKLFERDGFIDGRTFVFSLLKIWIAYLVTFVLILTIHLSTIGLSVLSLFSTDILRGIFSIFAFSIASAFWAQLLLGIFLLGTWYLSFINIFKRVRDIRGTNANEFSWKAATTLVCLAPTFNLFIMPPMVKRKINLNEKPRSSSNSLCHCRQVTWSGTTVRSRSEIVPICPTHK